ncbi:hypothetical protein E4U13_004161 [Claviceps humidiphila]|uniref:Nitrogen permease regulator 3 n=1 Tax=Claviceps humidiphila TaxID=1294629 RepID=A0A9P7TTA6_9HYPO|nr:hypothetical protein E4U13_004161 [Claviceps humidiphila]
MIAHLSSGFWVFRPRLHESATIAISIAIPRFIVIPEQIRIEIGKLSGRDSPQPQKKPAADNTTTTRPPRPFHLPPLPPLNTTQCASLLSLDAVIAPSSSTSPTPVEVAAERARLERIALKASREAARKIPPLATPHPSLNDSPHLKGLTPHIILDAKRMTGRESRYLATIAGRFRDGKLRGAWHTMCRYFDGVSALERIALQEGMRKKDVWVVLTAMSEKYDALPELPKSVPELNASVPELPKSVSELPEKRTNVFMVPLKVKEYVEECHTLDGKLDVVTELTLIAEGPVVDPGDRPRPRLIVPWKGFPEKQREILNKIPSDHKFTQGFPTRVDLRVLRWSERDMEPMHEPINSEYSLAINREEAVTRPVGILMREVRQNAELRKSLGIDGDVKFARNVNHGEATPNSHSQEPSGKNSTADEFCSIKRSSTGESEIVLAVQYKLPQKLPVSLLVAALDNSTDINLDTGFIDEGSNEFGPKRLVAAVIAQMFCALVSKGIRFGYIDTGEAKVFLHIGSDPSRLEYHLSCPRYDVQGEENMHLSAVSQLFAFVVQAIQASTPTKEWEIAASKLPTWKLKRVEIREKIPQIAEQTCEEEDPHSPGTKIVSYDKTPINTRSASRSTHHPPDKVDNEEEASGSGSKTGKEVAQNGGMDKRLDGRQKMLSNFFKRPYCTNECVWGLAFGGPLDENCPNVKDHGSKHIDRQEFLRLMGEQLVGDEAHDHCKPINASGHIGYLFKIRLPSHGYTLVAKAVALGDGAPLLHEEKMYNHLRDLQGRFIPVCPGLITLHGVFGCQAYDFTAFRHFLFLSYAGQPVLKALSEVDNSVVSQVLATLAQLHQHRVMHHDAAPRNMLYDDCTDRYMIVDLEMSKPIDEEVLEAMDGCRKKRTKNRELKTASESFAAESKSLLAKLSPSAGTCCRRFKHVVSSSRILVYMEFTPLYDVHQLLYFN